MEQITIAMFCAGLFILLAASKISNSAHEAFLAVHAQYKTGDMLEHYSIYYVKKLIAKFGDTMHICITLMIIGTLMAIFALILNTNLLAQFSMFMVIWMIALTAYEHFLQKKVTNA